MVTFNVKSRGFINDEVLDDQDNFTAEVPVYGGQLRLSDLRNAVREQMTNYAKGNLLPVLKLGRPRRNIEGDTLSVADYDAAEIITVAFG